MCGFKDSNRVAFSSVPSKIILFGEHFVVYGSPAILAAVNKRITATARVISATKNGRGTPRRSSRDWSVRIKSDFGISEELADRQGSSKHSTKSRTMLQPIHKAIRAVLIERGARVDGIQLELESKIPIGVGLGSSAAACVATIAAIDRLLGSKIDRDWVCKRAIEAERLIHRNSSGADCYACTHGGLIHYQRNEGLSKLMLNQADSHSRQPFFLACDSGVTHSTGELVASVNRFRKSNGTLFMKLCESATKICADSLPAIESGRWNKLGPLMSENHALLQQIGVSHPEVEKLIGICNAAGALGAKLTGAGGGGSVVALAESEIARKRILSEIRQQGYSGFEAEIDYDGLTIGPD